MTGLGSSLAGVTTEQKRILRKNKSKEKPGFSIKGKEPIQETVNPRKGSQGDHLIISENKSSHKIFHPFQHKVDYEGDTNEKNCNTND